MQFARNRQENYESVREPHYYGVEQPFTTSGIFGPVNTRFENDFLRTAESANNLYFGCSTP
jgi:hypothetical protein